MNGNLLLLLAFHLMLSGSAFSQNNRSNWITHPEVKDDRFQVLQFRNTFSLEKIPDEPILLSAAVRYKLYINGQYVGQGPANNDLVHYKYDEVAISKYLQKGQNVIAVTVFSLGEVTPLRFFSHDPRLLVDATGPLKEKISTDSKEWKVLLDTSYSPTKWGEDFLTMQYWATGGGEKITAGKHPWGWEAPSFEPSDQWVNAKPLGEWYPYGYKEVYGHGLFGLSKNQLPKMDEGELQLPMIRTVDGLDEKISLKDGFTVPAHSTVTLLLDQQYLTKGHPYYTFSGGNGAHIRAAYSEALYQEGRVKGDRDQIDGKTFVGQADIYLTDGSKTRTFSTLLHRTWRYIKIDITTAEEPLTLESFRAHRFMYPFEEKASFSAGLPKLDEIWEVGWRTARLCADETYMDCPFYEQLQYVGDTRIQTFISLAVSGDDRLMRNAIEQFAHSITSEGITQSRYPSAYLQYIPPYSLFWVNMLHDYHLYRNDDAFTKQYLFQVESVLQWFKEKLRQDHLLGPVPWWSYVDAIDDFEKGAPPGYDTGGSTILTLQYLYAIQDAIRLFDYHGWTESAVQYKQLAEQIRLAIKEKTFDQNRTIYADTPEKTRFSQHANILAILTDTHPEEKQAALFDRIAFDSTLAQANIYFRFYLNRAAQQTGKGAFVIENLDMWEHMLAENLTTFAEHFQTDTRSDCHAWSAYPIFEFLNTTCGIAPSSPHFETVKIAPNPGDLPRIEAKYPHPEGMIMVEMDFTKGKASGSIVLPETLTGTFHWKGTTTPLAGGKNKIAIK